jgi:hypothetical protein
VPEVDDGACKDVSNTSILLSPAMPACFFASFFGCQKESPKEKREEEEKNACEHAVVVWKSHAQCFLGKFLGEGRAWKTVSDSTIRGTNFTDKRELHGMPPKAFA